MVWLYSSTWQRDVSNCGTMRAFSEEKQLLGTRMVRPLSVTRCCCYLICSRLNTVWKAYSRVPTPMTNYLGSSWLCMYLINQALIYLSMYLGLCWANVKLWTWATTLWRHYRYPTHDRQLQDSRLQREMWLSHLERHTKRARRQMQ